MMTNVIFIGRRNEYARKKKRKKYFSAIKKAENEKVKKITENNVHTATP